MKHSNSSLLLQRRVVDFSSERSIKKTAQAIIEHYGFELSTSAITKITHATTQEAKEFNSTVNCREEAKPLLIVQMDGSMVPIVNYDDPTAEQLEQGLKRNRDCHWREFRLCSVSVPENVSKLYGVVLGSPLEAGCMMHQTCNLQGMNEHTHIHGVADGAPWIADQYENQFGMNHDFYIDYYHVSEYLAEASKELESSSLQGLTASEWLSSRKDLLLNGSVDRVIEELANLSNAQQFKNAINKAYHYLANRAEHLNYMDALAAKLPIGSGEVESGHRSVLQARLKKPGAWWRLDNAENMAHLKVLQENGHWEEFWQQKAA